jgi:predicted transcriptional regulator
MPSTLKEFIRDLAATKAPGPSTTFTVFHVFYALELMSEQTFGRNKLAEKLNVGEGAIRTLISRLIDAGLMITSKEGCALTSKGLAVWREFEEVFPQRVELPRTELTTSDYNYGFLVKNSGNKVKSGIDQRDAAIVAGAKRAIVISSRGGHLRIESVSESIECEFPKSSQQILQLIKPQDNDVIVIAGGDTALKAKRGAFAASWSLLNGEKKNR